MAMTIEKVTLTPHPPIPADFAGPIRADCFLSSDSAVKSVVAYLPDGNSLGFHKKGDFHYTAQGYLPYGTASGVYEIIVVATNEGGDLTRQTVSISIQS